MSEIKTGGPAFPGIDGPPSEYHAGMTLRDWFAGKAMQAALSNPNSNASNLDELVKVFDLVGRLSYVAADAMIAAREGGAA